LPISSSASPSSTSSDSPPHPASSSSTTPIIPFDSCVRIDLFAHQQQLQADVDHLESSDYAPTETASASAEWRPDPFTRRYLIAATRARSWRTTPALRPQAHRTAA
jgi:hypothetical protein